MQKMKMRVLVILFLVVIPFIASILLFFQKEYEVFTSTHSLFEDIYILSEGNKNMHSIVLTKRIVDSEADYVAYLPSEYTGKPIIKFQYASKLMIGENVYKSGDTIKNVSDGVRYSVKIFGNDNQLAEVGSITFCFADQVPSLYVDTESGTMDSVNSSPANTHIEPATYMAVTADGTINAKGTCKIKGRGNSTWTSVETEEKKPYNIELDSEASLFEMGKQKKWTLLANFFDGSELRSWVAYDIAKKLEMPFTVETQFVNVYFDGKYNGLYLMTQHIDVSGGNVDIYDLNEDNDILNGEGKQESLSEYDENNRFFSYYTGNSPANITGGYLLEFSTNAVIEQEEPWFQMDHNNALIESPKYPTRDEVVYIAEYMDKVEDSIFNTSDNSYRKYLDFNSWVNMYYMREFFEAWDGENNSSYIYKEKNSDILFNGPAWDYDLSMGQTWMQHSPFTTNCIWLASKAEFSWIYSLNKNHSDYHEEVIKRYYEIFEPLITEEVNIVLPAMREYIGKSAEMDYHLYPTAVREHYYGDFQDEYDYLKWWLIERTSFFSDYLQNKEQYIRVIFQGTNPFCCYFKKGTSIAELPYDNGQECKWFYDDGTEVQVGDILEESVTITSQLRLQ